MVDGTTRIDDINELIGTDIFSEDVETISGYIIGLLGRFCGKKTKIIETDGLIVTVEEIEKKTE